MMQRYVLSFTRMMTLAVAILAFSAAPAHAYIDPGAGSLVIQVVIAAMAGALFKIRAIKDYIKARFRKKK